MRRADGADLASRIPPGQYLTTDFPVLSAGPTPRTPLDRWSLRIEGLVREPVTWTWDEFLALPARDWAVDISCVTKWTKLDMRWRGVSVDTLLEHVELEPAAAFVIAWSDGGYTTNLPLADVLNGQAFVAFEYDGEPLAPEHGGPARLVVPGSLLLEEREVGPRSAPPVDRTSPASGSRSGTTTAATSGSKSATAATEETRDHGRPDHLAARDRHGGP